MRLPTPTRIQTIKQKCHGILVARRTLSTPASFYRGGTSKAIIFNQSDLPTEVKDRATIFLSALGSPDPNGRQLNGMGGGISSLSKVVVVGKSERADADVDYTFVQVGVKDQNVDYGSNCGNMLSAVGPFALEKRLAPVPRKGSRTATVRIFNTNTNKLMLSTFSVCSLDPSEPFLRGGFSIDGVSGTGGRIDLDFISPGGSRTGKLLPTGRVVDRIDANLVPGFQGPPTRTTVMDCANPCVFVTAAEMGMDPVILPSSLEKETALLARLEEIRGAAAVLMGLAPDLATAGRAKAVPKVCVVSPPAQHTLISGQDMPANGCDLVVRCVSTGDPHRAIPITAALCVAVAAQIDGSIVHAIRRDSAPPLPNNLVIGHPSGTVAVGADVAEGSDGTWSAKSARVLRTARKLFEGHVFWEPAVEEIS